MPEIRSMTAQLLIWLFGSVSAMHLIAMALVWAGAFIPGKLGFKEDPLLRTGIGIYLFCEAIVTLTNVGQPLSLLLTYLGGAAMFFSLGRLIRWLMITLKSKKH